MSDAYWNPFVEHLPPILLDFGFDSMEDFVAEADLILRGRLVETYIGEEWVGRADEPGEPFAYARFEVTDVLKGEPRSREAGFVEVQLALVDDDWAAPAPETIPTHDHLLFLIREATFRAEIGKPPRQTDIAPYAYFLPTGESLLRDVDGYVALVERESFEIHYPSHFALSFEGTGFLEFVQLVNSLTE